MNRSDMIEVVSQSDWASTLPGPVRNDLFLKIKQKRLKEGEYLFQKDSAPDGFYCLVDGRLRIGNTNREGQEYLLTLIEPGTWFGEISMLDDLPRTHDSLALEDCVLAIVAMTDFRVLLDRYPELYRHVSLLLCHRLRTTFGLLDQVGCMSFGQRLAMRLLAMNQDVNGCGILSVSQESLAKMIGTSRQTMNKLLQELESRQMIELGYGRVVLTDINSLMHFAQNG